jgi:hypothetical protein
MVQTAINAKIQNSPAPSLNKPLQIPDIKTVEEEKHWQEIVDAEREKLRPQAIGMEIKTKRFCEQCESKGVTHRKECPKFKSRAKRDLQTQSKSGISEGKSKPIDNT